MHIMRTMRRIGSRGTRSVRSRIVSVIVGGGRERIGAESEVKEGEGVGERAVDGEERRVGRGCVQSVMGKQKAGAVSL